MPNLAELAENANAWPFAEARALKTRLDRLGVAADYIPVFETGYGPSGLPHIGTFAEVVRTSMVRHAYTTLTGKQARLICFSDDMDGLRKVPDNIPKADMLAQHLDKPLTSIPNPFASDHASFAAHNNARLQAFLDGFGFEYEFLSATECYRAGIFDKVLLQVLAEYDAIMKVVLPTLGEERRATYSPFLPICPRTGKVLQVPITGRDTAAGTISYRDPDTNEAMTTSVTGGGVKLQWKCDWAMRWVALGVDYEMSGKDLSESVILSSKIARILGATPPAGFSYELFLDQNGDKISKSLGNGLAVEEWLAYGTEESLALFMYQHPRRAKRLYFDVVPRMVDTYYSHLAAWQTQDAAARLENPLWHVHTGNPPQTDMPIDFSLLLTLVAACHADSESVLWGYIQTYAPKTSPKSHPHINGLAQKAIRYYAERIRPNLRYRKPTAQEVAHLKTLIARLGELAAEADASAIQSVVFAVGKEAGYDPIGDWFLCLYQVLFGQDAGPRMGSFIKLYGISSCIQHIKNAIAGELAGDDSSAKINTQDNTKPVSTPT